MTKDEQVPSHLIRKWDKIPKRCRKIRCLFCSWRSLGESNPCFRRERATS
jgi:hypothetical protein